MASGGVTAEISSENSNSLSKQLSVASPNSSIENNNSPNQAASNVELVTTLSSEYASLIDIRCGKENEHFNETVEELLTKLDEFLGIADLIRGDDHLALGDTLATIHTKTLEMRRNFDRIDQLETFIAMVKGSLREMELRVDQAEIDLGTLNPIKKVFNAITLPSLFAPKIPSPNSAARQAGGRPVYNPVVIFNSEEIFKKADRVADAELHHKRLVSGEVPRSGYDLASHLGLAEEPTSADANNGGLSDSMSLPISDHSTDLALDDAATDDIFLLSDPRRRMAAGASVLENIPSVSAGEITTQASDNPDASLFTSSSSDQNLSAPTIPSSSELDKIVVEGSPS